MKIPLPFHPIRGMEPRRKRMEDQEVSSRPQTSATPSTVPSQAGTPSIQVPSTSNAATQNLMEELKGQIAAENAERMDQLKKLFEDYQGTIQNLIIQQQALYAPLREQLQTTMTKQDILQLNQTRLMNEVMGVRREVQTVRDIMMSYLNPKFMEIYGKDASSPELLDVAAPFGTRMEEAGGPSNVQEEIADKGHHQEVHVSTELVNEKPTPSEPSAMHIASGQQPEKEEVTEDPTEHKEDKVSSPVQASEMVTMPAFANMATEKHTPAHDASASQTMHDDEAQTIANLDQLVARVVEEHSDQPHPSQPSHPSSPKSSPSHSSFLMTDKKGENS